MTPIIPKKRIIDCDTAQRQLWDIVIIGSGMGGGTTAQALSAKGYRVVLIEKGLANFDSKATGVQEEQENPEERLASGKWPTKLTGQQGDGPFDIWAPVGCGVGGSSLLYSSALQRLRPEDFETTKTPDGDEVSWPFPYAALEPYYQIAEERFSVCGTQDPLEEGSTYSLAEPPKMCEVDEHLFRELRKSGFNPYRIHVGIKYLNGCEECGGRYCERACKREARNSCIEPAMEDGDLFVVERAETIRLNAPEKKVADIRVQQDGKEYALSGRIFVLAAGAYFTPVILLKSKNSFWPDGLANSSGLVGRNLMFHVSDFIAIWPKKKYSRQGPRKTIAVRDLYSVNGTKLGEFQSTGLLADYGNVVYALRLSFDQTRFKNLKLIRKLLAIPARIASRLFGQATVFATIVEDFPYKENRIVLDESAPSGMRFEYTLKKELKDRVLQMRKRIRDDLAPLRSLPMNPEVVLNYGHPCGTCKAGSDPKSSVVDENCKAHDLDNLYIADGSIMPTSGGTNPGLTIAANALRVADAIDRKLRIS